MFTEQDALKIAKNMLGPEHEAIESCTNWLMLMYQQGLVEGQQLDSKKAYWLGVKEGLYKGSWIAAGVRYVGPVASKETTLAHRVALIDEEMRQNA